MVLANQKNICSWPNLEPRTWQGSSITCVAPFRVRTKTASWMTLTKSTSNSTLRTTRHALLTGLRGAKITTTVLHIFEKSDWVNRWFLTRWNSNWNNTGLSMANHFSTVRLIRLNSSSISCTMRLRGWTPWEAHWSRKLVTLSSTALSDAKDSCHFPNLNSRPSIIQASKSYPQIKISCKRAIVCNSLSLCRYMLKWHSRRRSRDLSNAKLCSAISKVRLNIWNSTSDSKTRERYLSWVALISIKREWEMC